MIVAISLAFLCSFAAAAASGSTPYNAETHTAGRSKGCGKSSPYSAGKTSVATGNWAGVKWTYRIYVPRAYNKNTPMPVILQHPGWGMDAKSEENGAGITQFAESKGFISVTPQGMNDNPNRGGPWYSWNAVGTTQSPGPGGATCTQAANYPSYCYTSCQKCTDKPQCHWTTCDEEVTPTGTGFKNVGGFIPSLYDTLEEQLCIDTTREFAAGESNGGMMTYQLGVDLASRLAAIAPQFGSFHKGYNLAPTVGVPVIDLHGNSDTTVPANVSLSADGYYYTPTHEIFNGNSYSKGWKASNNCTGGSSHYKTNYDKIKKLWCVSEGSCSGGDVVRCSYQGGHNWFNNGGKDNGGIVTDFLYKWAKTSHIGRGSSKGEELGAANLLEDIVVLEDIDGTDDASILSSSTWSEKVLTSAAAGHYGNPVNGCLPDEDALDIGSGRICAPKIGTQGRTTPPTPMCKIGGVAAHPNGCPRDANTAGPDSSAWPICLGIGNNVTDAYDQGDFHCLLVCPCHAGDRNNDGQCRDASHSHCPQGARCERDQLRKRDQGVCTFPPRSSSETTLVV